MVLAWGALLLPINSAVHSIFSEFRDTFALLISMIAEYFLNISQPTKILKGKPFATRNIIGMVTPLPVTSNDTCFLFVLFCFPVAPIKIMLFIGRVGKMLLHSFFFLNFVEFRTVDQRHVSASINHEFCCYTIYFSSDICDFIIVLGGAGGLLF